MKLKIMTFNLRVPADVDGINFFPYRRERILACLDREAPDLIGFQEAGDETREFLRGTLSHRYVILGCGRNKNYRGESCVIAYRRDRFELVNLATRFLSDTPRVAGSRYKESDQSSCPRLFVHAELSTGEGEGTFHFINTHLDHKGVNARSLGMKQILEYADTLTGPVLLTGDMNARPDEECILLAKEHGLRDLTEEITHTFHGFGAFAENYKIDYIFTNGKGSEADRVEDVPENGRYTSDHYPLCATVEV